MFKNNYQRLIANHSLIVFSESLITTFLWIILLKNWFSLKSIIILFFCIELLQWLMLFAWDIFTKYLWLKRMLILWSIFYWIYYYVITFVTFDFNWILFYFLFWAFNLLFYWFPIHTIFSSEGSENVWFWVSMKRIVAIILDLIAPLIATYTIFYFWEEYLLYFAILLCVLSIYPIIKAKFNLDFKIEKVKFSFKLNDTATLIQIFSAIMASIINISWPIIIYFYTDWNLLQIWYILFLITLIEISLTFLWWYIFDKKLNNKYLFLSSLILCISIFSMSILPTFYSYFWITISWILYSLSNSFFDTVRTLFWYKETNKDIKHQDIYYNQKNSIIWRKIWYSIWTLILFIPIFIWFNLEYVFLFNIFIIFILYNIFSKLSIKYNLKN